MRDPTKEEQTAFNRIRVPKEHKAMFHITKTILEKSIQDANRDICQALYASGLFYYHRLRLGEKQFLTGFFKGEGNKPITVSCYRTKGRGDKRIWFKGIGDIAEADDMMALSVKVSVSYYRTGRGYFGKLTIHNLTDIAKEAWENTVYQQSSGFGLSTLKGVKFTPLPKSSKKKKR